VDHDIAFHMLLYRATGNPLLAPSAETHLLYCRRVMIAVLEFSDRGPVVWAQHRDILSAICSGRVEEAGALMTGHIYGSERAFTEALRRMNTDHSSIQH
jgi:DNA-binding GntR family transcriptional regulator